VKEFNQSGRDRRGNKRKKKKNFKQMKIEKLPEKPNSWRRKAKSKQKAGVWRSKRTTAGNT
jgi:hypothetical protein